MDWLSELGVGSFPLWVPLLVMFALLAVPLGPAEPAALATAGLVGASALPAGPAILALAAGMVLGDVVVHRVAEPLLGALHRKPRAAQKMARWERHLRRRPVWRDAAVFGLRFIPGCRTPAALAARAAGVARLRFTFVAAAGSLAWAGLWVTAGAALTAALPSWVLIAAGVAAAAVLLRCSTAST